MKDLKVILIISLCTISSKVVASSEQAWESFDREIRKACIEKSDLLSKNITGQRIDFDDEIGYSVFFITGEKKLNRTPVKMKNICLYNREKNIASVAPIE
ncbi:TPA: hypothetical protein OND39_004498 [Enterobacter asburiae]|nr:hypothetical protein [Enterobacter asburiae]